MTTIVSVTPLAVEADSRTFKQAASFARFGYRSIVVEGRASSLPSADLPFELQAYPTAERGAGPDEGRPATSGPAPDWLPPMLRRAGREPYSAVRWIRSRARDVRVAGPALPEASLYVLHEFSLFGAVSVAARKSRAPFVYDAHDLYSTLAAEQRDRPGYASSAVILGNLLERSCVRNAAACMTVAPGLAELQRKRFGRTFAVVRNAHDPRLDQRAPRSVRELAGAPSDALLVAVVGNAKPSMAITDLLDALTLTPEPVRVAFVGRGYEEYEAAVAMRDLGERVSFPGAVPPPQITSFLRDADAAASIYVPSSVNAFNALPNGFLQSLGAGLPTLYPRLPEIEAIAEAFAVGPTIDPRSPVALARQLRELHESRETLDRFRDGAREAARQLTWEHEETELERVLATALEGGRR